jgi:hypothetical protein
MLTNPEAASAASAGIARYEAQIAQAIPADDADLRAAIISAITLGITVSRHLIKSDELATADPAQVIELPPAAARARRIASHLDRSRDVPGRGARTQTTRVIRSAAISSGLVTESNETTLTWLLPNLSWAWFFLAPSW